MSRRDSPLRATPLALLLALSSAAKPWASDEPPAPVSLSYMAIESCPGEEAFWSALTSRSSHVVRASGAEPRLSLQVNIMLTPQGVLGRLQIVREGTLSEPRFVEASECAEVVQALALTAALSIEAESQQAAATPTSSAVTSVNPPEPERVPTDPPLPPAFDERWFLALHVHALGALLVDSTAHLGAQAALTVTRQRDLLATQTLGLAVGYLDSAWLDLQTEGRFRLFEAELSACPLTLNSAALALSPCLALQLGVLNANGQNLGNPESSQRLWSAAGLRLNAETRNSGQLRFSFGVSALVPLNPQRYQVFVPAVTVAETLPLSPWLHVGVTLLP